MLRALKKTLWCVGALLILLVLIAGGLFVASQRVPQFYEHAIAVDAASYVTANDRMLENVTALTNSLRREGEWQILFSERQINGWLAVDLPNNHPNWLPPTLREPRVQIRHDGISVAALYQQENGISSVLSLDLGVSLAEPNVICFQIRSAKAGAVPMPLKILLEQVTLGARQAGAQLEWRKKDGDPVAMFTIRPAVHSSAISFQIDQLQLRDGELILAGQTIKGSPREFQPLSTPVASRPEENQILQR